MYNTHLLLGLYYMSRWESLLAEQGLSVCQDTQHFRSLCCILLPRSDQPLKPRQSNNERPETLSGSSAIRLEPYTRFYFLYLTMRPRNN